jgi:ATP adenylyltransferase
MAYIDSHGAGDDQDHAKACPFCTAPTLDDEEGLIVWRGQLAFVVMNAFPYNPGHLLICPYRHFGDYTQATTSEVAEIAELTRQAMRVTREVSNPDGFNLGMNQGRVAGAGVAEHLHQHVVPRWAGDANFFPIIGQTKAIPQLLGDTRARLAKAWERS